MNNLPLVISNISIRQDSEGRYCLNDLHKASGNNQKHRPKYFLENQQTKELIAELLAEGGIPPSQVKHGVGTCGIKEIIYAYAMWISPVFNLKVIRAYDKPVSKPTLDNLIPHDDNEIAMSLESLLYRSYKEPLGVRALIWVDNGEATLVKQLKHSEVAIDSLDTQPLMTVIKQLTEAASCFTEKYNIDLYQIPASPAKKDRTRKKNAPSTAPSTVTAKDFYQAWVNEQLPGIPVVPAKSKDIFKLYQIWCQKSGFYPLLIGQFIDSIKQAGAARKQIRYRDEKSRLRNNRIIMPMGHCQQPMDKNQQEWLSECLVDFKAAVNKFNNKQGD